MQTRQAPAGPAVHRPDESAPPYVELRGVTKTYGQLVANDNISLAVRPGEIHVLVGENGAGKSTLMGILSGTVRPDSGTVLVGGKDLTGTDARTAIAHGIGMVHQHFRLVGAFTAAENIALGSEPLGRGGLLDRATARRTAAEVSERFGLTLDLDGQVDDMSVGMQQRVEIVKTLTRDARVLIFDEPTAVLTEDEAAALVEVLYRLRDDGRAILFITHKLREALALADTVSVLRRGRLIATMPPADTTVSELGTLMVGRAVVGTQRAVVGSPEGDPAVVDTGEAAVGGAPDVDERPVQLAARGTALASRTLHGVTLRDLNLEVHAGEVLGVLGVDGNGQQEVVSLLTGQHAPDSGRLELAGADVTGASPGDLLAAGLGVVPADRHAEGLVLGMSLARNLVLDRRDEARFRTLGGLLLKDSAINDHARAMVEKYDIRAQSIRQPVGSLSGGNQQKVVLARELERDLVALVAANPTRGLDVGSIEFVHRQLLALADAGKGVVVVTSDLDEALAISDRIAVLYHGTVVGVAARPFDRHQIGVLMGGRE